MRNGWEPGGPLSEVWSHLHFAVAVSLPSDDQIIMDHVKAALTLMESERQKAIREECNVDR